MPSALANQPAPESRGGSTVAHPVSAQAQHMEYILALDPIQSTLELLSPKGRSRDLAKWSSISITYA
jgi:hypothetical protein